MTSCRGKKSIWEHIKGLWKMIGDMKLAVWRSSDSLVISFNVQASLHHGAGATHVSTPHESALKENLVSGRQTSWLNRGFIETGLFTAFNFCKSLIVDFELVAGQCLCMEPSTREFVEIPTWIMIIQSRCKNSGRILPDRLALPPPNEKCPNLKGDVPDALVSFHSSSTGRLRLIGGLKFAFRSFSCPVCVCQLFDWMETFSGQTQSLWPKRISFYSCKNVLWGITTGISC